MSLPIKRLVVRVDDKGIVTFLYSEPIRQYEDLSNRLIVWFDSIDLGETATVRLQTLNSEDDTLTTEQYLLPMVTSIEESFTVKDKKTNVYLTYTIPTSTKVYYYDYPAGLTNVSGELAHSVMAIDSLGVSHATQTFVRYIESTPQPTGTFEPVVIDETLTSLIASKADQVDLVALDGRVDTLEVETISQDGRLDTLETEMDEVELRVTNLESDVATLQTEVNNIELDYVHNKASDTVNEFKIANTDESAVLESSQDTLEGRASDFIQFSVDGYKSTIDLQKNYVYLRAINNNNHIMLQEGYFKIVNSEGDYIQSSGGVLYLFSNDEIDITATNIALNGAIYVNGVLLSTTLGLKADLVDGKVPSSQLPSYVDDVLEYATVSAFPGTGESGKVYIAIDTNKTYRWSGSQYTLIASDLALGETSSTAYRGDRGKTAYDHSQVVSGNPHGTTFGQLLSKPVTLLGFGITDAYDKTYIDNLADHNGWEQTLLTLTPLEDSDTISTGDLTSKDKVVLICYDTATHKVDTDTIAGDYLQDGMVFDFFDNPNVKLTIGGLNSTFTDSVGGYQLTIYGIVMTQQVAENIAVVHSGTNYIDSKTDVKAVQVELDTQVKAVNTRVDNVVNGTTPIAYNPSVSGLSATTVKGAIDEVEGRVDTLETAVKVNATEITQLDQKVDTLEETLRKSESSDLTGSASDSEVIYLGQDVAQGQLKVLVDGNTLQATNRVSLTSGSANDITYTVSGNQITLSGTASAETTLTISSGLIASSKAYVNYDYVSGSLSGTVTFQNGATAIHSNLATDYSGVITLSTTTITIVIASGTVLNNLVFKTHNYSATTLISNKQYSPMFNTTFDLMSDANIKLQMDAWVASGELPNDNIQSVNGNKRYKSVGRNLWNMERFYDELKVISSANVSYSTDFGRDSIKLTNQSSFFNKIVMSGLYKQNTKYTIKFDYYHNGSLPGIILQWVYTDNTFSSLGMSTLNSWTTITSTSASGKTVKEIVLTYGTGSTPSYLDRKSFQLEVGSTATTYAPYVSSEMYLQANANLNRVPNGVKDTIEYRNGKYYHVKRVQEKTLIGSDITVLTTSLTNVDFVRVPYTVLAGNNLTSTFGETTQLYVQGRFITTILDSLSSVGAYYDGDNYVAIVFAKGTYSSLAQAQTALAGTKILYQLATPIETEIMANGSILGSSKATVYVDDAISDVKLYTSNIVVSTAIKTLNQIIKLNIDGSQTNLPISNATISGDGLSFTHTQLTSGDIVFISYNYVNTNNFYGNSVITYFDSRYIIADNANGKTYRWSISSTNGVASITLVEVL